MPVTAFTQVFSDPSATYTATPVSVMGSGSGCHTFTTAVKESWLGGESDPIVNYASYDMIAHTVTFDVYALEHVGLVGQTINLKSVIFD